VRLTLRRGAGAPKPSVHPGCAASAGPRKPNCANLFTNLFIAKNAVVKLLKSFKRLAPRTRAAHTNGSASESPRRGVRDPRPRLPMMIVLFIVLF